MKPLPLDTYKFIIILSPVGALIISGFSILKKDNNTKSHFKMRE